MCSARIATAAGRRPGRALAGRGLQEVRARIDRGVGGVADPVRGSALPSPGSPSRLRAAAADLVASSSAASAAGVIEQPAVEDHVHLVGARVDRRPDLVEPPIERLVGHGEATGGARDANRAFQPAALVPVATNRGQTQTAATARSVRLATGSAARRQRASTRRRVVVVAERGQVEAADQQLTIGVHARSLRGHRRAPVATLRRSCAACCVAVALVALPIAAAGCSSKPATCEAPTATTTVDMQNSTFAPGCVSTGGRADADAAQRGRHPAHVHGQGHRAST